MPTELIQIPTDAHPLDGLYYTPDGPARNAVVYFHGNQMNFYLGAARFLAPMLTDLGYAFLAFNRRGHDTVSGYDSRDAVGGAFQTTAEGIEDCELATRFLADRGFDAPIVMGHSNGGMLGANHVAHHPETPALVLLSAHRGGAGLAEAASQRGLFAGDQWDDLYKKAQQLVDQGDDRQLLVLPGWWHVVSARTFLDFAGTLPSTVDNARAVTCPSLFIRGDKEPVDNYPAEEFQAAAAGPCDVVIATDCDHYYGGAEEQISGIVRDWLTKADPA
jgi:pimeloyl-ACP methyl ester carboxylesterase